MTTTPTWGEGRMDDIEKEIEKLFPREKYYGSMWDDAKVKMDFLCRAIQNGTFQSEVNKEKTK